MKIKSLRVFNSVKCGKGEYTFLTDDIFDLTLDGFFINVKHKVELAVVIVPITNTPWMAPCLEEDSGLTSGTQDTSGTNKKKNKEASVAGSKLPKAK